MKTFIGFKVQNRLINHAYQLIYRRNSSKYFYFLWWSTLSGYYSSIRIRLKINNFFILIHTILRIPIGLRMKSLIWQLHRINRMHPWGKIPLSIIKETQSSGSVFSDIWFILTPLLRFATKKAIIDIYIRLKQIIKM